MIDPRTTEDSAAQRGSCPNRETLAYLVEFTKGAPAAQVQQSQNFDGKTVNVLGAATVILGLMAFNKSPVHASHGVIVIGIVVYLVAALATVSTLWVRRFGVVDDPPKLWAALYDEPLETAHWAIMDDLVAAYSSNQRKLLWKTVALSVTLIAAIAEAVLFAVAALV
jgi:hypothetical protein